MVPWETTLGCLEVGQIMSFRNMQKLVKFQSLVFVGCLTQFYTIFSFLHHFIDLLRRKAECVESDEANV